MGLFHWVRFVACLKRYHHDASVKDSSDSAEDNKDGVGDSGDDIDDSDGEGDGGNDIDEIELWALGLPFSILLLWSLPWKSLNSWSLSPSELIEMIDGCASMIDTSLESSSDSIVRSTTTAGVSARSTSDSPLESSLPTITDSWSFDVLMK